MSLPLRHRTVHFYELTVTSFSRLGVKNPSCANLSDLLQAFSHMAAATALPHSIQRKPKLHTMLYDWSYDTATNTYRLLISKANAELSDVALRDLDTHALRTAQKTASEGIEVSAHCIVRPNTDGRTAAVLLTVGSGIGMQDVQKLLRDLSRIAVLEPSYKNLFYFDDPSGATELDGQRKKYKVNYSFSCLAHKGQTIDEALQNGTFEGMELVAFDQDRFDAGGNFQIIERSLGVKALVPATVTGATVRNAIRAFRQTPDGKIMNTVRLRYKTPVGDSTSNSIPINDLDAAFTLKQRIHFQQDVQSQQTKLEPIILSAMLPLLAKVPV